MTLFVADEQPTPAVTWTNWNHTPTTPVAGRLETMVCEDSARGLATNLHELGVDDKTIQGILRHSSIGLTMNIYVKSGSESQVSALEKLETCNDLATSGQRKPN